MPKCLNLALGFEKSWVGLQRVAEEVKVNMNFCTGKEKVDWVDWTVTLITRWWGKDEALGL